MASKKTAEHGLHITVGKSPYPGRRSVSVWSSNGDETQIPVLPLAPRSKAYLVPLTISALTIADYPTHMQPTEPSGKKIIIKKEDSKVLIDGVPLSRGITLVVPHGIARRSLTFKIV